VRLRAGLSFRCPSFDLRWLLAPAICAQPVGCPCERLNADSVPVRPQLAPGLEQLLWLRSLLCVNPPSAFSDRAPARDEAYFFYPIVKN
jgi:hypothetical protein